MKYIKTIFFLSTFACQQLYGTIETISLFKSPDSRINQKFEAAKTIAQIFLRILEKEEYMVLTHQHELFNQFEKLLEYLDKIPTKNLDFDNALCFAQALQKGANIYRRIAHESSLKLALHYHLKSLEIKIEWLDCYAIDLAHSFADIGATYNEMKGINNNNKAIEYYNKALTLYEYDQEEAQHFIASTLHKLGNAYRDLDEKNINTAISYLNRALKIFNSLSTNEYINKEKAKILFNQGMNHHHLGDESTIKKALEYLHDAKTLFELNDDAPRAAMTLSYLGDVYRSLGNENISIAIDCLLQALEKQQKLFGEESPDIAVTMYYLSAAYYESSEDENHKKSRKYALKALRIQKKLLNENHPDTARTLYHLGLLFIKEKKFDDGIPLIKEAFTIFKQLAQSHYYIKTASQSFNQLQNLLHECNCPDAHLLIKQVKAFEETISHHLP